MATAAVASGTALCMRPLAPSRSVSAARCSTRIGSHCLTSTSGHICIASQRPMHTRTSWAPRSERSQLRLLSRRLGTSHLLCSRSPCRAVRAEAGAEIVLNSISPVALALLAPSFGEVAEGLEAPVQLLYLLTLLGFLAAGAYLVVRQVLIRRELEEAAKVLGERIRTGDAAAEDYFELGVILLRKKLYTQATKNLEKAKKAWTGEPEELAQVHNALGFAYFSMEKSDMAIKEYQQAVEKQPGYVTAWNNLGDAYERVKKLQDALSCYQEALSYAPDNKIAGGRAQALRTKLDRLA